MDMLEQSHKQETESLVMAWCFRELVFFMSYVLGEIAKYVHIIQQQYSVERWANKRQMKLEMGNFAKR